MTAAITTNAPMIPPAIAPTFGPLDFVELELIVVGAAEFATQTVFWQASQVGGTREQISVSLHTGQAGVTSGHPVTHRFPKREFVDTVNQSADTL